MLNIIKRLFSRKKMAEFSNIGSGNDQIPYPSATVDENALNLSNPDDILTGTQRGQQALGAPNIKTDSINKRIVVNDNTTNRVSFGKIGTGVNDWGLKVSKPTFNVDTATDAQLIFNSSQNVFKIANKLSTPFSYTNGGGAPGSTTATIDHNLGYVPLILSTVEITSTTLSGGQTGIFILPQFVMTVVNLVTLGTSFFTPGQYVKPLRVTSTQIQFEIGANGGTSIAGTITAYVLQESAT